MVVCITGLCMLGLLRPDAMTGWLSLMAVVVALIGTCIAVLIDENNRDRDRAAQPANVALPAPPVMRAVKKTR
jgi:hypothetical protein